MAKLIAVKKLYIYDDGRVDIENITYNMEKVCTEGCSSSIRQIIKVIEYVAKNSDNSDIRKNVSNGIVYVANMEGISPTSVHAKILRKLELSVEEFKDVLEEYFYEKTPRLEEILRKACVSRTKSADNAAIDNLFAIINNNFEEV